MTLAARRHVINLVGKRDVVETVGKLIWHTIEGDIAENLHDYYIQIGFDVSRLWPKCVEQLMRLNLDDLDFRTDLAACLGMTIDDFDRMTEAFDK